MCLCSELKASFVSVANLTQTVHAIPGMAEIVSAAVVRHGRACSAGDATNVPENALMFREADMVECIKEIMSRTSAPLTVAQRRAFFGGLSTLVQRRVSARPPEEVLVLDDLEALLIIIDGPRLSAEAWVDVAAAWSYQRT